MGIFLNAEGGDGSGKGTQMQLLHEYAVEMDYAVGFESFPRYKKPVAEPIKRFLNGRYGNPHPELASVPYALDRLDAKPDMLPIINHPRGVMLTDRFAASNLGHNGGKFDSAEERDAYFEYQRNFEHEILGIPKPDLNVILMVPPEISQQNVDKKAARDYTEKKRDIHEADINHLQRTRESYLALAALYPGEFKLIDCMETETRMRSIDDIQDELRNTLHALLKQHDMLV